MGHLDVLGTVLSFPVILTVIIVAGVLINNRWKINEREQARQMYERLVKEKLGLLNNAINAGYAAGDIHALDARLEPLIGASNLQTLLNPKYRVHRRCRTNHRRGSSCTRENCPVFNG